MAKLTIAKIFKMTRMIVWILVNFVCSGFFDSLSGCFDSSCDIIDEISSQESQDK